MYKEDEWESAPQPNYSVNKNLKYYYSDFPYTEKYKTVPLDGDNTSVKIKIVDYWGEGRIYDSDIITGFTESYNVNHQHQVVSNGDDKGSRIPNRIPVKNYDSLDTTNYIKNDFADYITVMGAPITKSCADDIRRMLNKDNGRVILYGVDDDSLKNTIDALKKVGFYSLVKDTLESPFNQIKLFGDYNVYSFYREDIFLKRASDIINTDYMSGVDILRYIYDTEKDDNYQFLGKVMDWSISNFSSGLIKCAHVLHFSDDKKDADLFLQFPDDIRALFNGKNKHIVNGNYYSGGAYSVYLKSAKNSYADIKVYGGKKELADRFKWTIKTISQENTNFFIHNEHQATKNDSYYLYLSADMDKDGDQQAWVGLITSDHVPTKKTYQWEIFCMMSPERIYFKFFNAEYHSKFLKVIENKDGQGDRKAMGSTFLDNVNYKRNWWFFI